MREVHEITQHDERIKIVIQIKIIILQDDVLKGAKVTARLIITKKTSSAKTLTTKSLPHQQSNLPTKATAPPLISPPSIKAPASSINLQGLQQAAKPDIPSLHPVANPVTQ